MEGTGADMQVTLAEDTEHGKHWTEGKNREKEQVSEQWTGDTALKDVLL